MNSIPRLLLGLSLLVLVALYGRASTPLAASATHHLYLPLVGGGVGDNDGSTRVCGALTGHRVWAAPVYTLTCDVTIPAGSSLTVRPGVLIQFADPGPYSLIIRGQFSAEATPTQPIRLQAVTPGAGRWGSLQVAATAILSFSNVEVRDGGAGNHAQIEVLGGSAEIDNSLIHHGINGISAQNTSLILRHSQVNDHTGYGLRLQATAIPTFPTIQANEFSRNGSYPALILLDAGGLGDGISANWGADNGRLNGLYLQGRLTHGTALNLNHPGFPYILGDVRVEAGVHVNLEPGLVLKFGLLNGSAPARGGGRLTLAGSLSALGRSDAPIVLTSVWDDENGYDANRDQAATEPLPGDWFGVHIEPGGLLEVSFGRFLYAGAASTPAILNDGSLTATNSVVRYSAGHGIAGTGRFDLVDAYLADNAGDALHAAGPGTIHTSSLINNAGYAIYNAYDDGSGEYRLDASDNYWGNSSGPSYDQGRCFHDNLPGGSGGRINCAVAWLPFEPTAPRSSIPASAKKGLAYWNRPTVNLEPHWELGWYTRYGLSDIGQLRQQNPDAVFIPMMWCDHPKSDPTASSIQEMLELYGADYDGFLIWVNEPELGAPYNQCELTNVNDAAQFYIATRSTFPNAKLVGTNNAFDVNITPYTLTWLTNWRNAVYDLTCNHPSPLPCGYPDMYAYGMHLFGESATLNLQLLDQYYNVLHTTWGIADPRIWVTEMTFCMNNPAHALELANTIAGFESRAFVERYAFWTNRTGNDNYVPPPPNGRCFQFSYLMDPLTGWTTPNILGETYRLLPFNYPFP